MSENKFSNMELMFLILRKNTKLLKEFINANPTDYVRNAKPTADSKRKRRNHIIYIKSQLSLLSLKKYNLLKTIATDINRFDILNHFSEIMRRDIPDTSDILKKYVQSLYDFDIKTGLLYNKVNIPVIRIIHDTILNHYFILENEQTKIDNIVLFNGMDHVWFEEIYNILKNLKEVEREIRHQQIIMKEKYRAEKTKNKILDKY